MSTSCTCESSTDGTGEARPPVLRPSASNPSTRATQPQVLYLPDAAPMPTVPSSPRALLRRTSCPSEMVNIQGLFCIDRFEATLVDTKQSRRVSPYYHPSVTHTRSAYKTWQSERFNMGDREYQNLPLPEPPAFQLREAFDVKAVVQRGAVPNGYMNQLVAKRACENAGKRLCTEQEWVHACRGESDRAFPYGDEYVQGKCNVFAGAHPAKILHGNYSIGHLDPRLNQFVHEGSPLLHSTGSNLDCASRWGSDAVYDMVGNLDEWIDDEEGAFAGGFFSRGTKEGCASKISAHPPAYFDYSLGVRCCQ